MELADLTFVHQKALGPVGIAIEDISFVVGRNVHIIHHQFSLFRHSAVAVFQIQLTAPDGLDLGAGQLDTGLIAVLHEIIVKRLAVLRRSLCAAAFCHGKSPLSVDWVSSIAHIFDKCKKKA